MKANAGKWQILVNVKRKVCAKVGPYDIQIRKQQKLLGVFIDILI